MLYSQIGRYEEKVTQPTGDILAKLANALEVTSDYLMNGTSDDLANSSLTDKELLNQFKMIEKMPKDKKLVFKIFLDALITKDKISNWLCSFKNTFLLPTTLSAFLNQKIQAGKLTKHSI